MKLRELYLKAKTEDRTCSRCGWMITKPNWDKGERLCSGCMDALRGIGTSQGYPPDEQEFPDKTGEMD